MVKQRHEPGPPMTLGNKTNAEEYRELAEQEAALAKAAITNESRPTITRWLPIHALGGGEGKVGEDDGSHDRRVQQRGLSDVLSRALARPRLGNIANGEG